VSLQANTQALMLLAAPPCSEHVCCCCCCWPQVCRCRPTRRR
jgi:hypothetical protein